MHSLEEKLSSYAAYHRDRRNILTHFLGIPMIVVSLFVLASPTLFSVFSLGISIAVIVGLAAIFYYIKLNFRLGMVMALLIYVAWLLALSLAASNYWFWGVGLFVIGWVLQLLGHHFEGKKPAFIDDITGLIIGPLFVVTEFLFMFNLLKDLKASIENKAGPVHWA